MKTNKAFTLIETLVVIVIIGILATITIPTFRSVKEKIRQKNHGNQPVQVESPLPEKTFKIGEMVVISGINKTGVVNQTYSGFCTIITTEGIKIDNINPILLNKINQ